MNDGKPNQPGEVLSYVTWMSLDQATRQKLVALFDIPRSGHTNVSYGVMPDGTPGAFATSDGHTPEDLQAVTRERMEEILGVQSDNFYALFRDLVENIDDFVETEPIEELKEAIVDTAEALIEAEEAVAQVEEEFVPRDPEELIKLKTGKDAKTKKAKSK